MADIRSRPQWRSKRSKSTHATAYSSAPPRRHPNSKADWRRSMLIRSWARHADLVSSAVLNWWQTKHAAGARAVRCAEQEGVIVRAVLGDVLTLCPPLIISAKEIDELFDRLGRALDKTFDWVRRERLNEA